MTDTNINEKYFFFSMFTPNGPSSGIVKNKSKAGLLLEFISKGVILVYLEELTKEEYTHLKDKMAELQSKPNIILAQGNVPRS